jgi:hypothetical protein
MPFAGYADFDACVAANSDKADPKAFCASIQQDTEKALAADRAILKVDEEQRMVFGWASVAMMKADEPVVDLQNDTIDAHTLEKAAYDYVRRYRIVNDMHKGAAVGDLVESFVVTPEKLKAMGLECKTAPAVGMWVGYKLDETEWAAFKRGERPMFSIEGEAEHA